MQGEIRSGGQDHFYLEGQIALAVPQESGGMHVHTSTQHPGEVQHMVSRALGIDASAVVVLCRRMGGGFGGKETQMSLFACVAAVLARRTGRAVKLRLDRDDDMRSTGKRHAFLYRYDVGFDDAGRILGLDLTLASRCGFSADLSGPINDRAVFHADNAYWLPDVAIHSYRCRTNTVSDTAFRGFGGPQGMFAIEAVIEAIAAHLGRRSAGGPPRQLLRHDGSQRHAVRHDGRGQHRAGAGRSARWHLALPRAARGDPRLEPDQPHRPARHRADTRQVRHLLHRHPLQPGRARWCTSTGTARCC